MTALISATIWISKTGLGGVMLHYTDLFVEGGGAGERLSNHFRARLRRIC